MSATAARVINFFALFRYVLVASGLSFEKVVEIQFWKKSSWRAGRRLPLARRFG